MKPTKFYDGSCYIGVVGPEQENGECRDSIENIHVRAGDTRPTPIRATKGYEARQMHMDRMLASRHDFLLLLDHDMIYQPDTLERLRRHRLPYVSGFYMRRRYAPMAPVWFRPFSGSWPFEPWLDLPQADNLYKIGASGWGCVLLHRDVIMGVRKLLHGELEVAEDPMEFWPFDSAAVMSEIRAVFNARTLEDARGHGRYLEGLLRPLRGSKDPVGSDIRFPFYAYHAGFQMYGDSGVYPSHLLNYPLAVSDYGGQDNAELKAKVRKGVQAERRKLRLNLNKLKGGGK
jgi:hypothetical protein